MLKELLEHRQTEILKKWFDRVVNGYKPEAARFLTGGGDRFANPVRHTLLTEFENIFSFLWGEGGDERLSTALENIIKITAVQDKTPSKALGFIFVLRDLLFEEVAADPALDAGIKQDMLVSCVHQTDSLVSLGFDIYSRCREKIYEIRIKEIKSQRAGVMARGVVVDG
ncbi:MAG: RsbRD N-terminal domain-containing protein [Deltaproteobacteria bacterium]|nr:RsbRD N-terminal domain-containing protein [Deltaproteobacteria bacterium]